MNKKIFYVVAGIATVVLVLYTYLGGFSEPAVTLTTSETKYVAGQPFEGSVEDEAMGRAFQRVSQVLQEQELQGHPGNIYYNDPDKSGDSIRAFIGIIIPDSTAKLPDGFTLRTVPGGRQVVRAEATANIALLPKKLYAAVFDHAEEEKLKLEEFYVEWFPENDKGVLEVPVKE
ncbi:GyrI-like domain-containing protein [Pontibacter kalidii]|uniref:GyrI-like domain-containing protein n=1 Tax=Pontibacter kalidii TaxID=2592049 RepID=UPI00224D3B03|nr:GyrI-like domain-containing protein [Pontibacter kalidii]